MKRQEKKRRPGLKRLTTRVMDERLSLIIRLFISPAAAGAADACVSTYSCVVKKRPSTRHYLALSRFIGHWPFALKGQETKGRRWCSPPLCIRSRRHTDASRSTPFFLPSSLWISLLLLLLSLSLFVSSEMRKTTFCVCLCVSVCLK